MPAPLKPPDPTAPMTSLRDVFAFNVRKYRVEKGLSQERLGFTAEMDRTFISQVERAKINVSINNIEKIATALEAQASDLLTRPIR